MTKIIETDKHRIQLQLWDTAGQELFRSVTRGYYRGSAGAFLIFDITSRDSFDHVGRWLQDVKEMARPDVVMILVGNKVDLESERAVSREDAEAFAKAHKMEYFETSAKTGGQIVEAVASCVSVIEHYVAEGVYEVTLNPDDTQLVNDEPKKSQCGC
jgi:small GTP-binding protein